MRSTPARPTRPGPADRRALRPLPRRDVDLRQPQRGGGLLRRVPHPAPGRRATPHRQAQGCLAQPGRTGPVEVQLQLPRRLGDERRPLRRREGPPPADLGGFLMVGDSVSWRADDELAAREPRWARPAPRPPPRRAAGPAGLVPRRPRQPDQLIVQLGTNRRRGSRGRLPRRDGHAPGQHAGAVPAALPQVHRRNEGPVRAAKKYANWMRRLAANRPQTCLADWPTYAVNHLSPRRRRAPRCQPRGLVRRLRGPVLAEVHRPARALKVP